MKFVILLLAVLLALHAGRCEKTCLQSCNGFCDLGFKPCSVFPLLLLKCVTVKTTCELKCTKFCSCVGQCQQDCTRPQGACNSTSPARGNSLCKSQQDLCKKASCPLKCFFAKDDKLALPNLLSALPKLGTGLPNPGTALQKFGTGLSLPTLGFPLPASGLPPPDAGSPLSTPGLFKPAIGLSLPAPAPPGLVPPSFNTKPADDAAKSAKESSATGPASLNPAGKTRSPAIGSPDEDIDGDYEEAPQAQIPPPKEIPKPAKQFPNSASSKSYNPGSSNPAPPAQKSSRKYSSLGGRK